MINVKEIVAQYLKAKGFDGLFNEVGECGCGLNDLMPCDGPQERCVPAIEHYCPCCGESIFTSIEAIVEQCQKSDEKTKATLADLFGILADGDKETKLDD